MAIKLVVFLSAALFLSNASAAKEQKKPEESEFSVVKCRANSSFYFQHRTIDCINEKGQLSCDHNGLFLANKRRCYQCCKKVNSTKSATRTPTAFPPTPRAGPTPTTAKEPTAGSTQEATPIPKLHSTPKINNTSQSNFVAVFFTVSAFTVVVVICVAFRHNLRDRCRRCRTIISQEEGTYMVKRGENGHESREYAGLGERTNGEDAHAGQLLSSI